MSSKLSRQAQRLEQERKRKQRQRLLIGGAVAAAVLIIAGIVVVPMLTPREPTSFATCSNVQQVASEGQGHLNPGDPTPVYKSNPPTSGIHNPVPYPAGVYDNNADITRIVHSLEHGYIVIYYNGLSQQEIDQLAAIQRSDSFKTIVVPYPNMPYKVAVAGWARLQTCEGVNEIAIRSFIAQFRGQGPEPFGA